MYGSYVDANGASYHVRYGSLTDKVRSFHASLGLPDKNEFRLPVKGIYAFQISRGYLLDCLYGKLCARGVGVFARHP